ncbi:MAG: acyl--CoA ligase [Clostridiales bacterium]|nr:acyl--CoA ligase [Clostridiales bacterium]
MESHWSVYYPEKYSNPKTDSDETLYMRIKRVCLANPARIALEYGTTKITYASLLEKINSAALTWKKLGVEKGDVVMIAMGNNPINIISVYALDKLGASAALAVPNLATEYFAGYANCVNAKFCVMSCNQYLNYSSVLKETGIKTVVIGKYSGATMGLTKLSIRFYPLYSYDTPKPKNIPEGIKLVYWEEVFSASAEQEDPAFDRDNNRTSLYLFPSVPTGCKATELNSRSINISVNLTEMLFMANEDMTGTPEKTLCLNECCFAFGFVVGIHSVLCCAQTVQMFTWYDSDKIFFAIRKYRPDVLIGYNSTVASINKAGNFGVLRTVNRIIVGGGLLTSSQKATLFENALNSGRKLAVCSIMGCDEILTYAYGPSDLDSDRLLGLPLPGVFMRIANKETGMDVPEGTEGEIAVYTPVIASSVANDNMVLNENYRKLLDGRIWFFTGMIGKQDGNKMFYLVGNKSRETRINSYPVYPEKVDEAVQMTEGVVESCTVIIEKPEGPVLITAVVPEEVFFYDNNLMEELRDRIKSECEMTLHEAMRPSEVIFFVSLPRNSKGDKDYEAVKERVTLMQDEEIADDEIPESEDTE